MSQVQVEFPSLDYFPHHLLFLFLVFLSDHSCLIILGLLCFKSDLLFNFDTSFNEPNSFTLSSNAGGINAYGVSYLLIETLGCATDTPYLDTSNSICFDVCPQGTMTNRVSETCLPCPFDCFTCSSNGSCLSCS